MPSEAAHDQKGSNPGLDRDLNNAGFLAPRLNAGPPRCKNESLRQYGDLDNDHGFFGW